MTIREFDEIVGMVIRENITTYIPESELDYTPHKFSLRHRRKMNKLMGKPTYSLRNITPRKMIAILTAAIIAACVASLSISAVREAFIRFITEIFETHTDVQTVETNNTPLDFVDIYEITTDLSDYELIICSEDSSDRKYIYQNNYCRIYFTQSIKAYYDVSVNTEGYDMEIVAINGYEGFYVDMYEHNGKIVTWDNGDYILSIFATYDREYDFSKNELIKLAESVQKVEK